MDEAAPAAPVMLDVGEAPAAAMGMTYLAGARSIGLLMTNAAAAQQRGQLIGETATVLALALILAKGAGAGA